MTPHTTEQPPLAPLEAQARIYRATGPKGAVNLRLRLCPDGYVSGYERAAVQHALAGIAANGRLFSDEAATDVVCDLVFDVETEAGVRMIVSAEGRTPAPFRHWLELAPETLAEALADFFVSVGTKTQTLSSSSLTTRETEAVTRIFDSLRSAALAMMGSTGTSPARP